MQKPGIRMLAACTAGGIHQQATRSLARANSCFVPYAKCHKDDFQLRPTRKSHNILGCRPHPHGNSTTTTRFGSRNVFGWAKLTSIIKPPVARREAGQQDPYDWLRSGDEKEIKQYLVNENAYAHQELRACKKFEKALFHEMEKRVAEKEEGVPELIEGWYYYMRTSEGSSFPIYCRYGKARMYIREPSHFNL
jgi:hypothetical protein